MPWGRLAAAQAQLRQPCSLWHAGHTQPLPPLPEQQSRAKERGTTWRHRGTDLAVALPRDRVTHAGLGASLVAVTAPALRVVVVARGTEVTLSPDDVGLAPGWTQEPEELSELSSPPFCTFPPLSLPRCPITPAGTRDAARHPQCQDKAPSPALPIVHVTARLRQLLHAGPGAVAVLTADEGVAAEGLGLADNTLWLQGVGRADALPRHFITETCPAVTGCRGQKEAGLGRARPRNPRQAWGKDREHKLRRQSRGQGNSRLQLGKPQ